MISDSRTKRLAAIATNNAEKNRKQPLGVFVRLLYLASLNFAEANIRIPAGTVLYCYGAVSKARKKYRVGTLPCNQCGKVFTFDIFRDQFEGVSKTEDKILREIYGWDL